MDSFLDGKLGNGKKEKDFAAFRVDNRDEPDVEGVGRHPGNALGGGGAALPRLPRQGGVGSSM